MRKRRVHATIMITVIVVAVVSGMLKWQLDAQAQRKEIARYEACQAQYLSTGIKLFEFGTTTDEYGNIVSYLDAETGDNATHLQQALDAYNADPKTTESVSYEEAALALRDDFIAVANHKAGKVSDFWIWGFTAPNLVSTDTGPTPTGNLLLPGDKDYDHPSCNFNYLAGDALLAGRFELWWKSETYARTGGWCLRQMGAVTVEVQPYGSHATSYSGGIVNGDTVDSYDLQAIEQGKDPLDHPEKDGTVTRQLYSYRPGDKDSDDATLLCYQNSVASPKEVPTGANQEAQWLLEHEFADVSHELQPGWSGTCKTSVRQYSAVSQHAIGGHACVVADFSIDNGYGAYGESTEVTSQTHAEGHKVAFFADDGSYYVIETFLPDGTPDDVCAEVEHAYRSAALTDGTLLLES